MANAVIVKFSRHGSALNVKSNAAAAAVDAAFGSKHAGNFTKKLLDGCQELKAVNSKSTEAYNWHIDVSLPLLDNGMRVIKPDYVETYLEKFNGFKSELQNLWREFEPVYSQAVADDIARLAGLADPTDYPTIEEMRYKYGIDVKFFPMPEKSDWRFAASEELNKQLDEVLEEAKIAGRGELFSRSSKVVDVLKTACEKTEKTRRHASSIENIKDLAATMDILNVHNDAEIRYLAEDLKAVVEGITIYDLKNSELARAEVVERCRNFLSKVNGNGFIPPAPEPQEQATSVDVEETYSREVMDELI